MTYSTHTHTRPGTVRACPDDIRLTIAVRLVSWAACYDFGGPGAADHPATEQPMKRKQPVSINAADGRLPVLAGLRFR